jgi:hypothetical protein
MIQKRAERIGPAGAVVSDIALSPAAIIDSVVRLDGCDYVQLREAVEILGRHVLSMLDAEPAVHFAVSFGHVGIQIKDDGNSLVANRMSADLQTGGISFHHAITHQG